MHHKTALNKDSDYSFINSSKSSKSKGQTLTKNTNSGNSNNNIDAAIRIIKNSIDSTGSIDSPLLFQIGEDDGLYQIIDLKGTCFQRYRVVL